MSITSPAIFANAVRDEVIKALRHGVSPETIITTLDTARAEISRAEPLAIAMAEGMQKRERATQS